MVLHCVSKDLPVEALNQFHTLCIISQLPLAGGEQRAPTAALLNSQTRVHGWGGTAVDVPGQLERKSGLFQKCIFLWLILL